MADRAFFASDIDTVESEIGNTTVQRLVQVAAKGLPRMFDPRAQLFCYKLKKTERGLLQEGLSPRYTAMTLLGLHRLQRSGTPSPVPLDLVLEGLLSNTAWADNIGDIGLLLWMCALMAPDRLQELSKRLRISAFLSDAKQGRTMELAWFLAGLSHCALARPDMAFDLRPQAFQTHNMLSENQGANGVFSHLTTGRTLHGRLRGHIGSFADQVYPIYALSRFYEAYQESAALPRALKCAQAICEAQGLLGQWWWHYDARNGRVFEQYPVYSVHQHGMAPMALLALSAVSNRSFDAWIYKGLDWIHERNELSVNMEDASAGLIWRCIQPPPWRRYSRTLLRRPGSGPRRQPASHLKVLFECRPYELGWLLYAFADSPAASQLPSSPAGTAVADKN